MGRKSKTKKLIFWLILLFIIPLLYFSTDLLITKLIFKSHLTEEKQNKYWRIKHNKFHHTLKPNTDVIEDNGKFGKIRFITNSLGFRDKAVRQIDYENTKYRIVFIGDSFTEGTLLNYEDTFIGMIDKKLEEDNIEVLNAGVGSYSPSIYYTKIKYFLEKNLKFNELVVFIDISDIMDEAVIYRIENSKVVRLIGYRKILIENFYLTYSILKYLHGKYTFTLNKYLHGKYTFTLKEASTDEMKFISYMASDSWKRDQWTISKEVYEDYYNGIENSIKYMKFLKELCNKHDIKLTVAVYPWFTQVYHNDLDSLQVKIWNKFSKENNLNFINYFPYFMDKNSTLKQRIKTIEKYYIPFDVHFNREGNKILSDVFLKQFISN